MSESETETQPRRPIQQRQSKFRRWIYNPIELVTRPPTDKRLKRSD